MVYERQNSMMLCLSDSPLPPLTPEGCNLPNRGNQSGVTLQNIQERAAALARGCSFLNVLTGTISTFPGQNVLFSTWFTGLFTFIWTNAQLCLNMEMFVSTQDMQDCCTVSGLSIGWSKPIFSRKLTRTFWKSWACNL